MRNTLLSVRNLTVSVARGPRRFLAVDDVSFDVPAGGALGIVGESGSGKSLTLRALMALLPTGVEVERGTVELGGHALPLVGPAGRRARRQRVAMVFQDPLSSLDPVRTVGAQVAEVPRRVMGLSRAESQQRAVELLRLVGMPGPRGTGGSIPTSFQGGCASGCSSLWPWAQSRRCCCATNQQLPSTSPCRVRCWISGRPSSSAGRRAGLR